MLSKRARLFYGVLKRVRAKAYVPDWVAAGDDAQELARQAKKRRRLDRHKPPRRRSMVAESVDVDGFALHYLRQPHPSRGRVMLYLHGGGYVIGPSGGEWSKAVSLAEAAGCDIALWDYPKAPEHDCASTLPSTLAVWDLLEAEYGGDAIVVVGASAGGGLAASLLVMLRDAGRSQPASAVLFSPWIDLSGSDPRAAALEALDHILSIQGLRRDAELYAGSRDLRDPVLSTLFADHHNLAPMQVHVGSHEIFLPDCTEFVDGIEAAGGRAQLVIDPQGQHVSPLFPTPEAKRLLDQAARFITTEYSTVG